MRHLAIDLTLIGLAPGAVAYWFGGLGLAILLASLAVVVLWPDRGGEK